MPLKEKEKHTSLPGIIIGTCGYGRVVLSNIKHQRMKGWGSRSGSFSQYFK